MEVELDDKTLREYHRRNVRVVISLLLLWFAVSILGIWTVRALNKLTLLEFPLGYWLGSQGSILTFVAEIFFYAKYMDRLDRKCGASDESGRRLRG